MTGRPERMEQTALMDLMEHKVRRAFRESKDREERRAQEGRGGQKDLPDHRANKVFLVQAVTYTVWSFLPQWNVLTGVKHAAHLYRMMF